MKKWTRILIAALLLLTVGVVIAQQYATTSTGFTVAASGTSNYTSQAVCTLTKYEDVTIHVRTSLAGSGTDNTVLSYSKSVDGTTYETTPSVVITVANTGTTAVNTITNINVGAAGYLRLTSIVNGDTGDALTVTNTFVTKPARFGN